MITTLQIKKIITKAYPFNKYSFLERRKLRKLLTDEILSYIEKHPNVTSEDLKIIFYNEELDFLPDISYLHVSLKTLVLTFIIVVLFCMIVLFFANKIHPPIYYF